METIIAFGVISLLIVIAPFFSTLTRLPLVVVEILLGALAYYFGFFEHSESLKLIAHIGFLFLMFLCGLEVNLKSFTKMGQDFLKKVGLYFLILYSITFVFVLIFELSYIYLAAFPVMSLGMIMTLIRDYGKDKIWLNLALSVGILGELVSIGVLVILNGAYSYGLSFKLYETLLALLLFLGAIVGILKIANIIFWWFPTLKFLAIPKDSTKNQDIRFSAMLLLIMIGIVSLLKLEAVLGAFLAGAILATYFHYQKGLVDKLNDFGFGFFIPLFFVYTGSTLDISLILSDLEILKKVVLIVVCMLFLRILAAFIAYGKYFKSKKNTLLFAFSHSMPLTFLVATAQLGKQFNAISTEEYYAFILAALLEGIVFMFCIKLIYQLPNKKSPVS